MSAQRLITQCPHCKTLFRITATQLRAAQGKARCSRCHEIFDALAALREKAKGHPKGQPETHSAGTSPHEPAAAPPAQTAAHADRLGAVPEQTTLELSPPDLNLPRVESPRGGRRSTDVDGAPAQTAPGWFAPAGPDTEQPETAGASPEREGDGTEGSEIAWWDEDTLEMDAAPSDAQESGEQSSAPPPEGLYGEAEPGNQPPQELATTAPAVDEVDPDQTASGQEDSIEAPPDWPNIDEAAPSDYDPGTSPSIPEGVAASDTSADDAGAWTFAELAVSKRGPAPAAEAAATGVTIGSVAGVESGPQALAPGSHDSAAADSAHPDWAFTGPALRPAPGWGTNPTLRGEPTTPPPENGWASAEHQALHQDAAAGGANLAPEKFTEQPAWEANNALAQGVREPAWDDDLEVSLEAPAPEPWLTGATGEPAPDAPPHATEPHSYAANLEREWETSIIPAPKRRRALLLGLASLVLVIALGAQGVYLFRDQLARNPAFTTLVKVWCHYTGCSVAPRRDVSRIELLNRDVRAAPAVANALLISLTLVNRAAFAQPFPILEISFYDVNGAPVALRRLTPAEYLPGTPGLMPVDTPIPVQLTIRDPGKAGVSYRFEFR